MSNAAFVEAYHSQGISDTPAWIVSKANQYAHDHGKSQFVIYQGAWNVMERSFERDIIPMARAEGRPSVLSYPCTHLHLTQVLHLHLGKSLRLESFGQTKKKSAAGKQERKVACS